MIFIAAAALGIWAHAEIETMKRRGFRECVHDTLAFAPEYASVLDADHKLALCDGH